MGLEGDEDELSVDPSQFASQFGLRIKKTLSLNENTAVATLSSVFLKTANSNAKCISTDHNIMVEVTIGS